MKKLNNITALLLVFVLCLSVTGCKKQTSMADYNLDEYITLPEYKGIAIDTKSVDYSFGIANAHYSNFTNSATGEIETEELSEGTVQTLDTVNIDYSGKKDGVAFDGGTATDYELMIGSGSFIDGFEAGLLGKKVGETVDLNLTFPENYKSKDLAGADVVFTVKINSISRPDVPEINEEAAKKLGYDSVSAYETSLEKSFINDYVWESTVIGTKVIMYPEAELNRYIDDNIESVRQEAESYGTNLQAYLSQKGLTEQTYREYLSSYAESYVLQKMVFYGISAKENITVSDAEVEEFVTANYSSTEVTKEDRQWIYDSLLQSKVCEFLAENAKIS